MKCLSLCRFVSLFLVSATACLAQADFSVDVGSPQVPAFSPADIIDSSGSSVFISAATLGLPDTANVNGFSYGRDEIEPLGSNFYVTILYSVDRDTVGLQGGPQVGSGIIWRHSTGNGAAGDKFYLKARQAPPPIGMFPVSRGLRSDAPMHNLTPLPPVQSDIDGMSMRNSGKVESVYYTVNQDAPAGVSAADILRVDIDPVTSVATAPRVWATAAQLGLNSTDVIDGLAIDNRDGGELDQSIVYVSLEDLSSSETVRLVYPGSQVIFEANILNLTSDPVSEELNALTGVDPGPLEEGEQHPPPQKKEPPRSYDKKP